MNKDITALINTLHERIGRNDCKGDGIKLTPGEGKGVIVSTLEKFRCEPEPAHIFISPDGLGMVERSHYSVTFVTVIACSCYGYHKNVVNTPR